MLGEIVPLVFLIVRGREICVARDKLSSPVLREVGFHEISIVNRPGITHRKRTALQGPISDRSPCIDDEDVAVGIVCDKL